MHINNETIFKDLLNKALTESGNLSNFYSYWHRYSFLNMLLLYVQGCVTPVATFKKFKEAGRVVKKGSKAKTILIPINNVRQEEKIIEGSVEVVEKTFVSFMLKNCIFQLTDTDGEPYYNTMQPLPILNKSLLLDTLKIKEVDFGTHSLSSNGFAYPNRMEIAISPLAKAPHKTLLHEISHCLLHKGEELSARGDEMPRDLKEVEAETTAYIVGSFLNILSEIEASSSRASIQFWLNNQELPEKNCKRIFGAVNKIIKALEINENVDMTSVSQVSVA